MLDKQRGFALIIVFIIGLAAIMAFAGWKAWSRQRATPQQEAVSEGEALPTGMPQNLASTTSPATVNTSHWPVYANYQYSFNMVFPPSFSPATYKNVLRPQDGFYFDDGYPNGMRVNVQFWGGSINDILYGVDQSRNPSSKPIISRKNFLIGIHEAITLLDTTTDDYGRIVYVQANPDTSIIFVADYAESYKYTIDEQKSIYREMIKSIQFLD